MFGKHLFSLVLLSLLILSGCSKDYYISPNFSNKTQGHKTIAVAPVEMVFSGTPLGQMEEEDIVALEEGESEAFQKSLFNELLLSSQGKKKSIWVDIMPVEKVNEILDEKGVSIRDSWTKTGEELSELLGVDAVVKARVDKQRYLTDLASYGVDIGRKVLHVLTRGKSLFALGGDLDKTSDMTASCSLINGNDAGVLWTMDVVSETDWNSPTPEVIGAINRLLAKNFPYRGKQK